MDAAAKIALVRGRGLPVAGDDIDTDRIIPARFLKAITFDGLEDHLFEDDRREAAARGDVHPMDVPAHAGARVLVVGANFGCGSSREHAPQAIRRWGIEAVVGESFAEIFFGNSVALGMPCVSVDHQAIERLLALARDAPDTEFVVDLEAMRVSTAGESVAATMPASAREAFLSGAWDATGLLLERYDEVERTAARLPYLTGFN
jgi:3-isopropylmalate/(R)-2-methylmalate dehydratase small subunit